MGICLCGRVWRRILLQKERTVTGKNSSPRERCHQVRCGVLGSVPYGNSRLIVMEGKPQQQTSHTGAMECTVAGHNSNTTVTYKEKILHVIILDICRSVRTGVYFFVVLFLPVQIDAHAGLKGQEVTCSLLPLDY